MARIDTNMVILDGRLGADAKLHRMDGGKAKVVFTIGSNGREKRGDALQDHVTWLPCVMWGEFAEKMSPHLTKGTWVQVHGHLRNRTFERSNGKRETVTEINVKHLVLPPPE